MKLYFLFLFILSGFIISCSEDAQVNGTTSGTGNGTLVGKVYITNPFGEWTANHSGVTLELEGTTLRTVSDSAGMWAINDIPPGTYVLLIKKEGYITKKKFNVIIAGKGIIYMNADNGYITVLPNPDYLFAEQLVLRPFEDITINYYEDSIVTDTGGTRTIKVLKTRVDSAETAVFTFRARSSLDHSKYQSGTYYIRGMLFLNRDSTADYENLQFAHYYPSPYLFEIPIRKYQDTIFKVMIEKKYLISPPYNFSKGQKIYCFGAIRTTAYDYNFYDPTKPVPIVPLGTSPNHTEIKGFVIP